MNSWCWFNNPWVSAKTLSAEWTAIAKLSWENPSLWARHKNAISSANSLRAMFALLSPTVSSVCPGNAFTVATLSSLSRVTQIFNSSLRSRQINSKSTGGVVSVRSSKTARGCANINCSYTFVRITSAVGCRPANLSKLRNQDWLGFFLLRFATNTETPQQFVWFVSPAG